MEEITFERLVEFNNAARTYLAENPSERSETTFALSKLLNFYQKKIEKIQSEGQRQADDEAEAIRVELCEKDNGVFKEKAYGAGKDLVIKKVFTSENEVKANKRIREKIEEVNREMLQKKVELKTHFVKVPDGIGLGYWDAFSGFIYKEMDEEEQLEMYLGNKKQLNGKV